MCYSLVMFFEDFSSQNQVLDEADGTRTFYDDVLLVLSNAYLQRKIACLRWEGSCMEVDRESVAVGVTRILAYRHFCTDVLSGWCLGILFAVILYLTYYPWPFAKTGTSTPLYKASEQDQSRNHVRFDSEAENDIEHEGIQLLSMTL